MTRLNSSSIHMLAKQLLGSHPNIAHFDLIYEIMQNLIPSEVLKGEPGEDFVPDHFCGLVITDSSIVFASLTYAFGYPISEKVDMLCLLEDLPGLAVDDNEKLQLLVHGVAKVIAAVAAKREDGTLKARIYWHPGIERIDAVGFLKSATDMARRTLFSTQGNTES